jgi:hypothetical protein
MSVVPSRLPNSDPSPVAASRTPVSAACGCARRTCWHARHCRLSGVGRIPRAVDSEAGPRTSVVLCRECATPGNVSAWSSRVLHRISCLTHLGN